MYSEADVFDSDRVPSEQGRSRSPFLGSRAAPWLTLCALSALGYAGARSSGVFGPRSVASTDDFTGEFDVVTSKVKIPVVVQGFQRSAHVAQQNDFRDAVRSAIAKQLGNSIAATDITLGSFSDAASPKRTTFDAVFSVPPEIAADALVSRLNDGRKLRKAIEDSILAKASVANLIAEPVSVFIATPETTTVKTAGRVEVGGHPQVSLDLQIKGLDYTELSKTTGTPGVHTALQRSFSEAIQTSIASSVTGLSANSIGLDLKDGKTDGAGSHWVLATAAIPPPAGLAVDATMSKWPGGPDAIAAALEKALHGLSGIEVATDGGLAGRTNIEVYPGPLLLGSIRDRYESQFSLEFTATSYTTDGTTQAIDAPVMDTKFTKALAALGNVDESEVKVTHTAAHPTAVFTAVVTSPVAISADWQTKWQNAAVSAITNVTTEWKAYRVNPAAFKIDVKLPFAVAHAISSIDVDFVIQGVDYNKVSADKQHNFAANLVKLIQTGILDTTGNAFVADGVTTTTAENIDVTLSPGTTPASIFVTARFPFTQNFDQEHSFLQQNMQTMLDKVKAKLTANTGLKYFTSWTTSSIKVTLPGVKVDS